MEYLRQINFAEPLKTLYLGGGTPNFLTAAELDYLFENIRKYVPMHSDCEISCEMNPETLTPAKMQLIASFVNRISLGVQSFDDAVRRKLMRRCSGQQLQKALELIKQYPIKHFNIDLIYGVNTVEWQIFEQDLAKALDWGVDHLSCYALTAEENSILGLHSPVADDESSAQWWQKIGDYLAGKGMFRYEISNYARKGGICQHNKNVWQGDNLLGIGAAASGFNGRDRYTFDGNIDSFLRGEAPEIDRIPPQLRMLEIFAVNLRTVDGWEKSRWEKLYANCWQPMLELCRSASGKNPQWWHITDDEIKLQEAGLLFWDDVAAEVLDWSELILAVNF